MKNSPGYLLIVGASLIFNGAFGMGAKAPSLQTGPGEPQAGVAFEQGHKIKSNKPNPFYRDQHPKGAVAETAFVDDCTQEAVTLAPISDDDLEFTSDDSAGFTKRISLVTLIDGLTPLSEVWVKSDVGPVTMLPNPVDIKNKERRYHASAKGTLMIRQPINLAKWRKSESPTLVAARVDWIEKAPKSSIPERSGTSSASIAMPSTNTAFRATSQPVCYWQSPVTIVSEYKANAGGNSDMTITHTEELDSYVSHQYGLGIGAGTIPEGPIENSDPLGMAPGPLGLGKGIVGNPFFSNFKMNQGYLWDQAGLWFVFRWDKIYDVEAKTQLTQTWSLHNEDGGFFGQRYTFTRFKAESYEKVPTGRCGGWKVKDKGYLDIGISSVTLYAVPRSLSASPDNARAFMEKILPPLNTCNNPPDDQRYEAAIQSPGHMFFFPN